VLPAKTPKSCRKSMSVRFASPTSVQYKQLNCPRHLQHLEMPSITITSQLLPHRLDCHPSRWNSP
jgi:hypothetical protein